jgi:molybdate transport system substrate-binding protein
MDEHGADMLEAKGPSKKESRIPLGESFIGMVVKAGQPKPDISTVDKLRQVLLNAKSVAYSDSSSGTYLSTVGFKKLDVAEEVAKKSRKVRGPPTGEPVAAVVARGEAEIGFQQVAELIHVPGIDFVGTVPAEIQPPTYFVGELTTKVTRPDAAVALLKFLSSADAAPVISKSGPEAARALTVLNSPTTRRCCGRTSCPGPAATNCICSGSPAAHNRAGYRARLPAAPRVPAPARTGVSR